MGFCIRNTWWGGRQRGVAVLSPPESPNAYTNQQGEDETLPVTQEEHPGWAAEEHAQQKDEPMDRHLLIAVVLVWFVVFAHMFGAFVSGILDAEGKLKWPLSALFFSRDSDD